MSGWHQRRVATVKLRILTGDLGLGLTNTRLVPAAQRPHIALASRASLRVARHGSQHGIPVLSTFDGAARARHVSESCDVRWRGIGNSTFLVGSRMLSEDQHHVVGRVVVQHGLEVEELFANLLRLPRRPPRWPAPLAPQLPVAAARSRYCSLVSFSIIGPLRGLRYPLGP